MCLLKMKGKKIVCSVYRVARTRKTTTTNSNLLSQTTNSLVCFYMILTFFFSFACLFVSHTLPFPPLTLPPSSVRLLSIRRRPFFARSLLANCVYVCVYARMYSIRYLHVPSECARTSFTFPYPGAIIRFEF